MRRPLYLLASISVLVPVHAAIASTWKNIGSTSQWGNPSNWSPSVVPSETEQAIIRNASIDLGGDRTAIAVGVSGNVNLSNGTLSTRRVVTLTQSTGTQFTANLTAFGPTLELAGFDPPFTFGGSLLGSGYTALLNDVTATAASPFDGPTQVTGTVTFSGNGSIASKDFLLASSSVLELDNSTTALPNRLVANAVIRHVDPDVAQLRLIGNDTQPVVQNIGTLALGSTPMLVNVQAHQATAQLHVNQITRDADAVLMVALSPASGDARFTTATLPELIGGTGGTQTPIVPMSMAVTPTGFANSVVSNGFLTYDTTLVPGGSGASSVVGFRALRPDEFNPSLNSAAPLDNVHLAGANTTLNTTRTINALSLASEVTLDLSNADLTLTSGGLLNFGTLAGDAVGPILRASGTGRLRSDRRLQIIAGSNLGDARRMVISAPISAPSLVVVGPGWVELDGVNDLPGGIRADAALTVGRAEALGSGPLTITKNASVSFVGDQTIPNTIHFDNAGTGTLLGIEPGHTVTFGGPVEGVGRIATTGGGLLRMVGGGAFSGGVGIFRSFDSTLSTRIEFGGVWTTPPAAGIIASGFIYGDATVPLSFTAGTLSAGAPDAVGTLQISTLLPATLSVASERATIRVDVAGATADRLVVNLPAGSTSAANHFLLSLNVIDAPVIGTTYTIIQNDTNLPALTPFVGLAEQSVVTSAGYAFVVSYVGGDGSDVTLTAVPEPTCAAGVAATILLWRGPRRARGWR